MSAASGLHDIILLERMSEDVMASWFAGMTQFKAVYVFEYQNPRSLHAKEFIHLLPDATEVGDGNVRSLNFPRFYKHVVTVEAPEAIDPATTKKSRTFYGFHGETMQDVVQKLNESVQVISGDA
tara:strand:+ start:1348 stop:1719 length:372 start_codon:yes stop_codon:yes gene_type:complete